jgi:hypothetical protein
MICAPAPTQPVRLPVDPNRRSVSSTADSGDPPGSPNVAKAPLRGDVNGQVSHGHGQEIATARTGAAQITDWLSEGEGSDTTGPRPGSTLLTYTEFRPGSGQIFPSRNLGCKRSKSISEDHNMLFTWENVELRGLEPLASCMPCKSSDLPDRASVASTCDDSAPRCP